MRNFLSKNAIFVTILGITLVTILFVCYNYYRINNYYQRELASDSTLIIKRLNTTLNEYDTLISATIDESKDKPCTILKDQLTNRVLSKQDIRSLTITYNDRVYCSSDHRTANLPENFLNQFTDYPLNILHSRFSEHKLLIIIRNFKKGDRGGLLTSSAIAFLKELSLTIPFAEDTYIIINNKWLNIKNYNLLENTEKQATWQFYKSDKYPFSIAFNLSAINKHSPFYLSYILIILGGITLCGASIFYIVYSKPKHELKRAILNNEIVPYYQLLVSANKQEWVGVEVLSRWQHPKKGLIMPSEFIPLAERSGLIVLLTKRQMQCVAKDLAPHVGLFPKRLHIGINIHQSQLKNYNLLEDCKAFLAAFPPNSIQLVLEIVESQFIEQSTDLDDLLQQFRNIQVNIAIDDFGTGFSNFGYLQKYHIDHLKVDKLFVSKICSAYQNTYLLDTLITLAKKLNMSTIAEGVETKEQFYHLVNEGIDTIQGFLFSKPVPLKEMLALLSQPVVKI